MGPYGGTYGTQFTATPPSAYITGFHVCKTGRTARYPDYAAGFDLYFSDGSSVLNIGCFERRDPWDRVTLGVNEFITEVDIYTGANNGWNEMAMEGLTFRTSTGAEHGPYGVTSGNLISMRGERLNGIEGLSEDVVYGIRFEWEGCASGGFNIYLFRLLSINIDATDCN